MFKGLYSIEKQRLTGPANYIEVAIVGVRMGICCMYNRKEKK